MEVDRKLVVYSMSCAIVVVVLLLVVVVLVLLLILILAWLLQYEKARGAWFEVPFNS